MTRPLRLLVSGYYGFANAGDEAILAGLVEGFRRLSPDAKLTVLSGDPAATTAEHGIEAVPRGLTSVFSQINQTDLLVSGGGGLLQDATSWRSPLYYLAVLELARAAGVPVACIGQSIGPLRRRWVRWWSRRALTRVPLLTVRDSMSEATLHDLGVRRDIHVTGDLAFILPPPSADEVAAAWEKAGLAQDSRPALGIALRDLPGGGAPGLAAELAGAIGRVAEDLGLRPILIPMQFPRDVVFAENVAAQMPVAAEIARPRLAAREILALIGGCELVIAMRLHALIFAAICRRPMVAVSYDPKVDGLMGELGRPVATSAAAFDGPRLFDAVSEAWTQRDRISESLGTAVERLRAAAVRNIELSLALIRG